MDMTRKRVQRKRSGAEQRGIEVEQQDAGVAVNCVHTKMVSTDILKPNPRNPNKHPKSQVKLLAEIIKKTGWRRPITISTRSGYIVKGHCALEAAKLLKLKEVPVDFQSYKSAEEEYSDLIADNRIAELSNRDDDVLIGLLEEIKAKQGQIILTGYLDDEFNKMIDAAMRTEQPEVEFTEELLLEHNYVVLYFDDPLTWQVAQEKFGLKRVRDLVPRKNAPVGVGRVLKGKDWIDRIK
jgi:hypothetical protein